MMTSLWMLFITHRGREAVNPPADDIQLEKGMVRQWA
jgi:hypothetical protein